MLHRIPYWIVSGLVVWVTTVLPAVGLGAMIEISEFWTTFFALWLIFGSVWLTYALTDAAYG